MPFLPLCLICIIASASIITSIWRCCQKRKAQNKVVWFRCLHIRQMRFKGDVIVWCNGKYWTNDTNINVWRTKYHQLICIWYWCSCIYYGCFVLILTLSICCDLIIWFAFRGDLHESLLLGYPWLGPSSSTYICYKHSHYICYIYTTAISAITYHYPHSQYTHYLHHQLHTKAMSAIHNFVPLNVVFLRQILFNVSKNIPPKIYLCNKTGFCKFPSN